MDYKSLYVHLFHETANAVQDIMDHNYGSAKNKLMKAQLECEEMYLQGISQDMSKKPETDDSEEAETNGSAVARQSVGIFFHPIHTNVKEGGSEIHRTALLCLTLLALKTAY